MEVPAEKNLPEKSAEFGDIPLVVSSNGKVLHRVRDCDKWDRLIWLVERAKEGAKEGAKVAAPAAEDKAKAEKANGIKAKMADENAQVLGDDRQPEPLFVREAEDEEISGLMSATEDGRRSPSPSSDPFYKSHPRSPRVPSPPPPHVEQRPVPSIPSPSSPSVHSPPPMNRPATPLPASEASAPSKPPAVPIQPRRIAPNASESKAGSSTGLGTLEGAHRSMEIRRLKIRHAALKSEAALLQETLQGLQARVEDITKPLGVGEEQELFLKWEECDAKQRKVTAEFNDVHMQLKALDSSL